MTEEKLERNRKLFYEVADYIELYPERYNQEDWGPESFDGLLTDEIFNGSQIGACGTHMCIAGTAAVLAGWYPTRYRQWATQSVVPHWGHMVSPQTQGNNPSEIFNVAAAELGIEDDFIHDYRNQRHSLFSVAWRPKDGMTVPDALRALGDGTDLADVSQWIEPDGN